MGKNIYSKQYQYEYHTIEPQKSKFINKDMMKAGTTVVLVGSCQQALDNVQSHCPI